MVTSATPQSDGRAARAERTRDAVVNAMLSLIDDGQLRPTARQVSERAGVSLRSVFQHFEDLETLFAAAADRQFERLSALASRIPGELPFEGRLQTFIEERARLFEALTPVRRSAILQEPFSREIARRLKWARDANRAEIERVFAAELDNLPEGDRADVVAALHATTEWTAWETLRAHNSLTVEGASRVMSRTIRALLGAASSAPTGKESR